MAALEKKLADLEQQLTAITPVLNPTEKLIDETLWDVKTVLEWVKQRIALSEEIQPYSEAINTISELELISAYEQEITIIASELKITGVKAAKIIALIVQGKTKSYLPILTPQEYQKCLINIEKSKRDLYYRTARKEVDGLEKESRPAFTRLHVHREMPTDFSNIKDGYLLILPHTFYQVDSKYLYPFSIKKIDLFSKKLGALCNSRLDAYTPSLLMDSLVEWQTQELQSSDKRILLFAEEGNLHKKGNLFCKMCLPNGNTISITLEKMPYSINNLPLIKKAVLIQIKENNLLSPIDLTSSEVANLITANTTKASHEQRIKISKLTKLNPSFFQAEDAGTRARNSLPQLSASLPTFSSAFSNKF